MRLKNNLKTGQVSLEYLILFAVIIISLSPFLSKVRTAGQELYAEAVARIIGAPLPPHTPPPSPPLPTPGEWSDEVASAKEAVIYDRGNYYAVTCIYQGGKSYILIDPKKFGITPGGNGIKVVVRDPTQGQVISITSPKIYKLDANNNLIKEYTLLGDGDFANYQIDFSEEEYNSGVKFLVEITENGSGSQCGVEITWTWTNIGMDGK